MIARTLKVVDRYLWSYVFSRFGGGTLAGSNPASRMASSVIGAVGFAIGSGLVMRPLYSRGGARLGFVFIDDPVDDANRIRLVGASTGRPVDIRTIPNVRAVRTMMKERRVGTRVGVMVCYHSSNILDKLQYERSDILPGKLGA